MKWLKPKYLFYALCAAIVALIIIIMRMVNKAKGAITNDQVQAFLMTIRQCEGTAGANGYNMYYTGVLFSDLSEHPNVQHCANGWCSTAAGAYQMIYGTWKVCAAAMSLTDFSEASQDAAAVYLITQKGALDAVMAGDMATACKKLNSTWASLPGSTSGQPQKALAKVEGYFTDAGGTLA